MLGAASCSASSGGLQWRSMGSLRFMARSTARDRMRGSTYPRISIQKNRVMLARTLISLHAGGMVSQNECYTLLQHVHRYNAPEAPNVP
ncbi:Protein of unknown function [Gryllus bimaculatus]|nr:Protein of unknown function [Gryllus bimaculatus]